MTFLLRASWIATISLHDVLIVDGPRGRKKSLLIRHKMEGKHLITLDKKKEREKEKLWIYYVINVCKANACANLILGKLLPFKESVFAGL